MTPGFSLRYTSPSKSYLTEDELDLVRDSQLIEQRIPVYIKLAEKRLVVLGILKVDESEKSKKKKKSERKENKEGTDENAYLLDFTRSELLRGYAQALDEAMSNIDDAYERKLDVRQPLEDLEKFTRETIPLLEGYKPNDESEKAALTHALEIANEALSGAKKALTIIPKTEKKKK